MAGNIETLEFVIRPNGRVEERVIGVSGEACTELTADIEAQLGCVVSQQQTSEFYQNSDAHAESSVAAQNTFSQW